jgi:hypothetical protein
MLVQIAKDRFFPATECVIGQRHRDWHVDADHADVDAVCEITRGVAIAGKDRCAVAVFVVDGKVDRLFICFGAHCGQNWAKDLFFIDVHVRCDMVKEVGTNKETVFVALKVKVATVDNQSCTLGDACFNKA